MGEALDAGLEPDDILEVLLEGGEELSVWAALGPVGGDLAEALAVAAVDHAVRQAEHQAHVLGEGAEGLGVLLEGQRRALGRR